MSEGISRKEFENLEPSEVWRHFETLCSIPRASKKEAALRQHLEGWAKGLGLEALIDAAGNLIIRKPASPGREGVPGVILQAHIDMVCQKNSASSHDFSTDPIIPVRRDGWLVAEETTLGADNGIGVALILAVLADRQIEHGPIEALLTVDEEAGMGGARGLAPDVLNGQLMLNLDTEDWGEFFMGCAGGCDLDVRSEGSVEAIPAGWTGLKLSLRGLRGGHSGVDIHEERGNAIKLLVRTLMAIGDAGIDCRLGRLFGGTARNALPREAFAELAVPSGDVERLASIVANSEATFRDELRSVDEALSLAVAPVKITEVMGRNEQQRWLGLLHAAPHGVHRISRLVPGVVETSNNLGMVDLTARGGTCNFLVRSLVNSGGDALVAEIQSLCALAGLQSVAGGAYPGWAPNPDSQLLALCQEVFRREFDAESRVQVIHAGLECGLISARYPQLDIVSFGPTIRGAHAPGESVNIASVGDCWRLLKAILAAIA